MQRLGAAHEENPEDDVTFNPLSIGALSMQLGFGDATINSSIIQKIITLKNPQAVFLLLYAQTHKPSDAFTEDLQRVARNMFDSFNPLTRTRVYNFICDNAKRIFGEESDQYGDVCAFGEQLSIPEATLRKLIVECEKAQSLEGPLLFAHKVAAFVQAADVFLKEYGREKYPRVCDEFKLKYLNSEILQFSPFHRDYPTLALYWLLLACYNNDPDMEIIKKLGENFLSKSFTNLTSSFLDGKLAEDFRGLIKVLFNTKQRSSFVKAVIKVADSAKDELVKSFLYLIAGEHYLLFVKNSGQARQYLELSDKACPDEEVNLGVQRVKNKKGQYKRVEVYGKRLLKVLVEQLLKQVSTKKSKKK